MNKNKPKIIFIDWNKTLSNSIFWHQLIEPGHKLNGKLPKIESVLFSKEFDLVNPWMLGKINSQHVCEFISEKTGISSQLLQNELEISCRQMTFVNKEVEKLLNKIKKKGIPLVIATDNMDTFTNYTYPEINKNNLFAGCINSYETGCFKYECIKDALPFFDSYLRIRRLTYRDVVLIDDSIEKNGNFQRLGFEIEIIDKSKPLTEVLKEYVKT